MFYIFRFKKEIRNEKERESNSKIQSNKSADQDIHTHVLQESKYERDGLCYYLRIRERAGSIIHKFIKMQEANCR